MINKVLPAQNNVLRFLRHLLPIISDSPTTLKAGKVMRKVNEDLDFYLPFRRHAPSLANARRTIYADTNRLANEDGVGFFNVLAFRGVFFGSPFARSSRFRWFESFNDWTTFQETEKAIAEEVGPSATEYYVKPNCYGRRQKERSVDLLPKYWNQRARWNDLFNKLTTPSVREVYRWLASSRADDHTIQFRNIGSLTAFLICGDLVEAGVLPMPIISSMDMGATAGMKQFNLVPEKADGEEICQAFILLDETLQRELGTEEKKDMGYNVIMLEHALCKMSRLISRGLKLEVLLSEI